MVICETTNLDNVLGSLPFFFTAALKFQVSVQNQTFSEKMNRYDLTHCITQSTVKSYKEYAIIILILTNEL